MEVEELENEGLEVKMIETALEPPAQVVEVLDNENRPEVSLKVEIFETAARLLRALKLDLENLELRNEALMELINDKVEEDKI